MRVSLRHAAWAPVTGTAPHASWTCEQRPPDVVGGRPRARNLVGPAGRVKCRDGLAISSRCEKTYCHVLRLKKRTQMTGHARLCHSLPMDAWCGQRALVRGHRLGAAWAPSAAHRLSTRHPSRLRWPRAGAIHPVATPAQATRAPVPFDTMEQPRHGRAAPKIRRESQPLSRAPSRNAKRPLRDGEGV